MRSLLTITIFLVVTPFVNGVSQSTFNESKEIGIHFGTFYFQSRGLLLEPGIQFKLKKNLFLLSNEFFISDGIISESSLGFSYRRYPFSNEKITKIYFLGGIMYMHNEGYSPHPAKVDGVFLIFGSGFHIDIIKTLRLGFEVVLGPGNIFNSDFEWGNSDLLFHVKTAITISYSFKLND